MGVITSAENQNAEKVKQLERRMELQKESLERLVRKQREALELWMKFAETPTQSRSRERYLAAAKGLTEKALS